MHCSVPDTRRALSAIRSMWADHSESCPLDISRLVPPHGATASSFAFAFVLRRHRPATGK